MSNTGGDSKNTGTNERKNSSCLTRIGSRVAKGLSTSMPGGGAATGLLFSLKLPAAVIAAGSAACSALCCLCGVFYCCNHVPDEGFVQTSRTIAGDVYKCVTCKDENVQGDRYSQLNVNGDGAEVGFTQAEPPAAPTGQTAPFLSNS